MPLHFILNNEASGSIKVITSLITSPPSGSATIVGINLPSGSSDEKDIAINEYPGPWGRGFLYSDMQSVYDTWHIIEPVWITPQALGISQNYTNDMWIYRWKAKFTRTGINQVFQDVICAMQTVLMRPSSGSSEIEISNNWTDSKVMTENQFITFDCHENMTGSILEDDKIGIKFRWKIESKKL